MFNVHIDTHGLNLFLVGELNGVWRSVLIRRGIDSYWKI